jgi:hypothetical protein
MAALTLMAGVALALAATGLAASTTIPLPRLVFDPGMTFSPKVLPKRDFVPAHATLFAKVRTTDGTHPSALREVVLDIERDVKVDARDYPACGVGGRGPRDPARARRACRESIIGSGVARFIVSFPERPSVVVESPVTVFNGDAEGGEARLLVHAFSTVPVPVEIVARVAIEKRAGGIRAVVDIPVIAGGSGSLLDLKFSFGKIFTDKGRRLGLVEARCPDGKFEVTVSKAVFRNEAGTPGVPAQTILKGSVLVPCKRQA